MDEAIAAAINRYSSVLGSRSYEPEDGVQRRGWYSRVAWGRVVGWLLLLLIPVALYFYWGPFRRVTQATYTAATTAIDKEVVLQSEENPGNGVMDSIKSSVKTVIPQDNRGAVFAPILQWLKARRPKLSLKQRIDEIAKIDSVVTQEVRCVLFSDAVYGSRKFKTGQAWTISRASAGGVDGTDCLILVLTTAGKTPKTLVFVVSCYGDSYDCTALEDPDMCPEELLRETLQAFGHSRTSCAMGSG